VSASVDNISITDITIQSQVGPVSFIQFVNHTAGELSGEIFGINISGVFMERGAGSAQQYVFYSDGSWTIIDRISMTGCYINSGFAEFFGFPSNMRILAFTFTANQFIRAASLTLSSVVPLTIAMSSQQMTIDNISITSSSAASTLSITGVEIVGNVTVAGLWRGLSIVGGSISGTLTNNATANQIILVPNQITKMTQDLNLGEDIAASTVTIKLNAAAGQVKRIRLQDAGVDRTVIVLTAGGNFAIQSTNAAVTRRCRADGSGRGKQRHEARP